jgi:crotonobetainyl-CoA:carnitine CoA-transferase CaiB-like acyl-CoA transferase
MSAPLAKTRVLDMSRILAGPWASQLLADLGAEVIKVERPGSGDDTRGWGPPFLEPGPGQTRGDAAYYLAANRGKHSLAIDIARPEGQAVIRKLVGKSDVLLENYKLGGLAKYGLDYASLAALNPRLVYCSITGFGQSGPYAAQAGYDFIIQGMAGLMSVTGRADEEPGGEPLKVGVAVSDLFTGLYATIGILAALQEREASGRGQYIDLSLFDTQVALLANQALNYLVSGRQPPRLGNAHPNIVPYQVFATRDGHLILAVGNDSQFRRFCELAGRPELAADERFATNAGRVENRALLIPLIDEVMAKRDRDDWLAALSAAGIPGGPINTLPQVFADPQVKARGLETETRRPDGTVIPGVANPLRFSRTPLATGKAPPGLAEDTGFVLREIAGLSDEEIDDLRRQGVVAA